MASGSRGDDAALARALAAECALAAGEAGAAAELGAVATQAAGPVDVFVARLEQATALERSGDRAGASAALETALRDRPGHPEQAEAVARLRALGRTPPSPGAPAHAADPDARAEAALRAHRPSEALEALRRAPRPRTRAARAKRLHLEGMALYGMRTKYAEAARVLGQAARLGGPDAIDDAFHAARATSRAGDTRRAITAYRRLIRAHPRHPRAAEAAYLVAQLTLGAGGSNAHAEMARFVEGPYAASRPEDTRAALFRLGFHFFEQGRYEDATRYLVRFRDRAESALDVGRAHYWLGRAHAETGHPSARDELVAAMHHEPLGWYAQLAHRRLVAMGVSDLPPPFPDVAPGAPLASPEEPTRVELPPEVPLFVRLGLHEDALAVVRGAEDAIRATSPRAGGLAALHAAYDFVGEVSRPFRLAAQTGGRFAEPALGDRRALWDAAYPRPYRDVVERAAATHGVPVEHVYATMRQESAFDPRALSRAGAMGLLQLMPATAQRAAERLGLPFERERLFEPDVNVELGVAEMAALSARWGGRLPLVIAAYNAGSHRVKGWLESTGRMETDRFVERIPYDETRNYVRRVIGHFARYRYLRGGHDPWDVPIPESVDPAVEPNEPTGIP